jgi:hypothetical protein
VFKSLYGHINKCRKTHPLQEMIQIYTRLSQWFIMLCLWLYCISKMSLTCLTYIRLSQWFIMLCLWLYVIWISFKINRNYSAFILRFVSKVTLRYHLPHFLLHVYWIRIIDTQKWVPVRFDIHNTSNQCVLLSIILIQYTCSRKWGKWYLNVASHDMAYLYEACDQISDSCHQ